MTPTTISEAEARIEAALKVARMHLHGSQEAFARGGHFTAYSGSVARAGLSQIISILSGGHAPQEEAGSHQPQKEIL